MTRIRRAATIWATVILLPMAMGLLCGLALDPFGLGRVPASNTPLGMPICGLSALVAIALAVAVAASEIVVLALTALLDWLVGRWLPRSSPGFAAYRLMVGVGGGLIGGGILGLPFAELAVTIPAVVAGPIVGLLLNLPPGSRFAQTLEHHARKWRILRRWSALEAARWAVGAWNVWLGSVLLAGGVGLLLAGVRLAKGDVAARDPFSSVGLAYSMMGFLAGVAGWSMAFGLFAATAFHVLAGLLSRRDRRASSTRWLLGGLAGAVGAGLAAYPVGRLGWIAAMALAGGGAALLLTWRRLRWVETPAPRPPSSTAP